MGNPADREGDFRGVIVEYGIQESKREDSQSVMIPIKVKLTEIHHEGEWCPWEEYDQEAYGSVCIVKADGNVNTVGIEQLMGACGWDGSLEALDAKTWQPIPCQVWLQANEYNGKTSYKVASIKKFDDAPGGGGIKSVASDRVKALSAKYGSQFRAARSTMATNSKPAASGKPPAPKGKPTVPAGAPTPNDEVPF